MNAAQKVSRADELLREASAAIEAELQHNASTERGELNWRWWIAQKRLGELQPFFSQAGQDWFLDRSVFDFKSGGVFVDIGGFDGFTNSNSLFFEVFRGWRGLLIEPAPQPYRMASSFRRCNCLQMAIGAEPGTAEFMHVTDGLTQMSGLVSTYDAGVLKRVRMASEHREEIIEVEIQPLEALLRAAGLSRVDYVSVDVEGSELDILQSFPFTEFDVTCWSIENAEHRQEIPALMEARGYDLIEYLGADEIYHRRS
ncbi:MAG: FkbM family methyltransferase [Pseudomonadota bacterium]